jgi:uncharacterized protein (UPF0333 family)
MKLNRTAPKKTKAQAMVEFALVLPLLLLLLYGILEAGRLLFIYSTIVTASRQAVRYGSATGQGLTTTVPRYRDCAGIRLAAQKVDFLNAFNDDDIHIYHDDGPDPANPSAGLSEQEYCFNPAPTDTWDPGNTNNKRLIVKIDGDYLPIIPKLIPFIERSVAKGDPIHAVSARTILVSVAIVVTVPPSTFLPSTPTATATVNTPTFTPSNTPTNTLTNTPIFTDTPSLTPLPTLTPTFTLMPTITNSPTITLTPTITPTIVPVCNNVTTGTFAFSGNTMTMTITNPNVYPITVSDVFVVWNHDKGHRVGDKSLILQSASISGSLTPFWTGNSSGPSNTLTSVTPLIIPGNGTVSTITFTFNQSYDNPDNSEETLINLSTPGCEGFPIHETR